MLPYARLEAFRKVVEFFVPKMTNMTDAECRLFNLSLSFADLNSKLAVEASNQSFNVEACRGDHTGNPVTWSFGVDLHVRLSNERSNSIRHCRTPRVDGLFALAVNELQSCVELEH